MSRAFHSRLVSGAVDSFQSVLDSVDFTPSPIHVFSNTTALPYPADPGSARTLLAGQLARPVEFVAQIEAMYRMGARTFVEVGPDAKLTALVRAILEGRDHHAIAVDASRGEQGNVDSLARTLASLAAHGYAVDLTGWDGTYQPSQAKRPGLTVSVCGANARPKAPMIPVPSYTPVAPASPVVAATDARSNGDLPIIHESRRPIAPAPPSAPPLAVVPVTVPAPPAGIAAALENSRQSLMALERLAEQTATLHRQFLEGQAQTQQSFLKLLEHEQRLSWALLGSPARPRAVSVSPERWAPRVAEPEPIHPITIAPPSANGTAAGRVLPVETPRAPAAGHKSDVPSRSAGPAAAAAADGSVVRAVIDVVSEKTGYPADVLELDMQLDADLGIDSIKRVEILSALARSCSIPPGDFPRSAGDAAELCGRSSSRSPGKSRFAKNPLRSPLSFIPSRSLPLEVRSRVCCSRQWPTRRAIPLRCSSWTCGWIGPRN